MIQLQENKVIIESLAGLGKL